MKLLNLLKEQPRLTQKEVIVTLKVSRATIQRSMKELVDSKASNRHDDGLDVGLEDKVLVLISENPKIPMSEIAQKLNVAKRTIERAVKSLREKKRLERKGGKRYGYWEVHE